MPFPSFSPVRRRDTKGQRIEIVDLRPCFFYSAAKVDEAACENNLIKPSAFPWYCHPENGVGVVALDMSDWRHRLIGFALAEFKRSATPGRSRATITRVAVHPSFQRKGVATRLIAALCERAKLASMARIGTIVPDDILGMHLSLAANNFLAVSSQPDDMGRTVYVFSMELGEAIGH